MTAIPEGIAMGRRKLVALTIWSLLGFAALIALGTWQIQRLHWKEKLIAERQSAIAAAPVTLPRSLEAARGLDFHRVSASGTFVREREFYVYATERESGDAGVLVVTPLRLDDGATVMVERGWIPNERRARVPVDPGRVTVDGLLRLPPRGKPGWFVPDNEPARNQWFYIDIAAMARAGGIAETLPFYIEAGPTPNPGVYPRGGQANTDLPNNHLQYAITWYALAATLAIIYFLVLRRERDAARTEGETS